MQIFRYGWGAGDLVPLSRAAGALFGLEGLVPARDPAGVRWKSKKIPQKPSLSTFVWPTDSFLFERVRLGGAFVARAMPRCVHK
jgi:hypothetical protein